MVGRVGFVPTTTGLKFMQLCRWSELRTGGLTAIRRYCNADGSVADTYSLEQGVGCGVIRCGCRRFCRRFCRFSLQVSSYSSLGPAHCWLLHIVGRLNCHFSYAGLDGLLVTLVHIPNAHARDALPVACFQ